MENQWLEESGSKTKASHEQPETRFQTAGILLSLRHSSLPTRSLPDGCMNVVQGFPYLADTLNQFQTEKSHKTPLDLRSYTGGRFNNVLRVNSQDRVVTAIGFTGFNCFIPQFADLPNGYYLPSPLPSGGILKTSHLQTLTPDDQFNASISGNSNNVMSSFPLRNPDGRFFGNSLSGNTREDPSSSTDGPIDVECEEQLLSNQNRNDVTNSTISENEAIRGNECHVCGKVYARPSTLKTHLRTHTGEKPFKCSICFKSFAQDANLTAHLRIHSGEKPFQCTICDRRFAQSSSVTTHMRIHSGERPYKCKVCSRGFADSSTLTKHLRIHTGEKPYQCKVCEMRFSQSGNLSRHMRVHKKTLVR